MWFLGFLFITIVYVGVAVLVAYLVRLLSNKKVPMWTVSTILLLLPVAYVLILFLPGYIELQSLCESDERSIVYQTVSVDGYLYASVSGSRCTEGRDVLLDGGYKFFECSTAKISDYVSFGRGDTYRFGIAEEGNPRCIDPGRLSNKMRGCLIREQVKSPKSRYVKLLEFGYVNSDGTHVLKSPNDRTTKGLISFVGYHVVDRTSGTTLAVSRDYKFWPLSIQNQFVKSCSEKKHVDFRAVMVPNQ